MYKTAFLHVAYDKAGSTALQSTSAAVRDELQSAGVNYPEPVVGNNHNRIASAFLTHPGRADFNQAGGRSSWPDDRIRQQDRGFLETYEERILAGRGTLFLSFEGFIWLSSSEQARLRDWLLKFAREVKVIVYVRDPLRYAESAISQRVRTGRPIKVGHHRHHVNIARLVEVYGRNNVIVREFGRKTLEGSDVRYDCYTQLGLVDKQINQLLAHEAVPAQTANTALSMHGIGIGEALRRCLAGTEFLTRPGTEVRFFRTFGDLLNSVPGPDFHLSLSQEAYLFSRPQIRAATRYLLNEFGIDFRWRRSKRLTPSHLTRFRHKAQFEMFRNHGAYTRSARSLIRQMSSQIEEATHKDFSDPASLTAQGSNAG